MQKQTTPYGRRISTKRRGVSYRVRTNGTRLYSVYAQGTYHPVEGGFAEAIELQAVLQKKTRRGERIVTKAQIPTYADYTAEWLEGKERRLRPWTLTVYKLGIDNVLLPRFGARKVTEVGVDDIASLIRDLEDRGLNAIDPKRPVKPLAPSSIRSYLLPLSGTLDLAVRRGLIQVNPVSLLTLDERPKQRERKEFDLDDAKVAELVACSEHLARQDRARYDYSHVIFVGSKTALRLGELLGLQWGDVDLREGTISVRRQLTQKGTIAPPKTKQALRVVPISPDVVERLRVLRGDVLRQSTDPVFSSLTGGYLSHRNVQSRGFDAAAEMAGLEGVSFHSLRHAAISRLIASGALSPPEVAAVVGHADSRVTLAVYAHVWGQEKSHDAVRLAMSGAVTA